MRSAFIFVVSATLMVLSVTANSSKLEDELIGTWSGSWTLGGGIRDAMTIQVTRDEKGNLTGRFLTPIPMNFIKTAFNSRTRVLRVDATDETSGKQYTLNGKLEGTEIKGTVTGENLAGPVDLIKWTYVPPMQW